MSTTGRMIQSSLHLRVFLSSPGDVTDERALAREIIERIQSERAHRDRLRLEIVAWDKPGAGTAMPAHLEPQEALDKGLRKPSACEIVIVIFGYRMGTPLSEKHCKPNGERYWSGTEYEFLDALNAAKQRKIPDVLVYRKQGAPDVNAADLQREEKLKQWDRVEAFFAGFRNADGSFERYYRTYATPTQFKDMLDEDLRDTVARHLEKRALPANVSLLIEEPVEEPVWHGSPYPGLRDFRTDEAPIFFGRDRETDEFVEKLSDSRNRLIVVMGASGTGKSSLVAAGLLPRLQKNAIPGSQDWILDIRFTPAGKISNNALMVLASQLAPKLEKYGRRPQKLADELAVNPGKLSELVNLILQGRPDWSELLLFVDQFEELFNLVADRYQALFIELLVIAEKTPRVRTIVTLRADFVAACMDRPVLNQLLKTTYFLTAPYPGDLYEMITKPAARAGLIFDKGLAKQIANDTGMEPGALALMAFALAELYKACLPDDHLTQKAYESFGGVRGAIVKRAEDTFSQLDPKEQAVLSDVFRELVEVDERRVATRRRAARNQVCRSPAAEQFVNLFIDARLLVTTEADDQRIVELAHEALLRSWPRLAEWIETVGDDLRLLRQVRSEAANWNEKDRPEALLWPHERLLPVQHMIERLQPEFSEVERVFVRPEAERLLEELEDPRTSHYRRATIGDRLAQIGDLRRGVGLRFDGVPDIDWVRTDGGHIELEDNAGVTDVNPFHIARFPITWQQYRAFLQADDGYFNNQWWRGLQREKERNRQYRPIDNCPAENVSWFDAVAFCRWLTVRLGFETRLPDEFEWKLAARGKQNFNYPWGPDWQEGIANTKESRLNRTTAVGLYPHGKSLSGVMDLAGNVWEWCLNKHDNLSSIRSGGDIQLDYSNEGQCVVRAGSWNDNRFKARLSYREYGPVFPRNRFSYIGFRTACYLSTVEYRP